MHTKYNREALENFQISEKFEEVATCRFLRLADFIRQMRILINEKLFGISVNRATVLIR